MSMTPKEFAEKMRALNIGDEESDHGNADDLLCELLRSLGYSEGVEEFEKMKKWYA